MQHDYDLANAPGSTFRSDLNDALAAIKTLNSGATAPSSTSAFMLWADTANNLLKIRNAADSAWVTIGTLSATNLGLLALTGGTLTGALQVAVGTVGACGLSFASDANTGLYSSAADILGLVAAGTEYLRITSAGGDFLGTGSVKVPVGTTAQRPVSPADGHLRYNSDNSAYEGYVSSAWQSLAVGSILPNVVSVTAAYTTTSSNRIVYCSSPSTQYAITLHTPTANDILIIERTDNDLSKVISITGTITGKDGVDVTNYALYTQGEKFVFQYNTTTSKWRELDHTWRTDWVDNSEGLAGYYTFTISSGNATLGATYTNNGNTYTVAKTVAAGLTVVMTGPAAPAASGTLTKTTGTGDATLTFSTFSGSAYRISGTTTAPTFYGTPIINKMIWRRSGKFVTVKVSYQWTVAGLGGTGDYIFPMPLNITIDTTYYPLYTGGNISAQNSQTSANIINMQSNVLGRVAIDSGGQFTATQSAPYTSTSYRIWGQYNNSDSAFPIGSNYCTVANAVACYIWEVTFPVSGWKG